LDELAAPRTFKITENGPSLKKSGHPCSIASHPRKYTKKKNFLKSKIRALTSICHFRKIV
jgi:hypothetical protein